jgi:threonine dehydrogenase-like Zn-dependent dehydrogenase
MATALAVARPGAMVGFVGIPHGVEVPINTMFAGNIGLRGGSAPVRTYIPELLEDVLEGRTILGAFSTSRPTWTVLRKRTPPWTSAARSSRSCG